MPKIISISTQRFCVPLAEILTDAKHGDHTHFELVTASITTEDGVTGTGYTYTGGKGGAAIKAMIETDLVGVELPKGPQPLLRVCTALLQAELNIIQAYPLIVRPNGNPAVAIMVENIELAMETLREKNFTILSEGDLEDDPTREL